MEVATLSISATRFSSFSSVTSNSCSYSSPGRSSGCLLWFQILHSRVLCTLGHGLQSPIENNTYRQEQRARVVAGSLPTVVSAAITVVVVGGAVFSLLRINKDKIESLQKKRGACEVCGGSGLCPACNGEGFILKNLSPQAATKARLAAKDAATRNTAGLAKKWNYCTTCLGARGCPSCQGRGWVEKDGL